MKITLYTKDNCPGCEAVKIFLKEKSLTDVIISNITNDMTKIMWLKEKLDIAGFPASFPMLQIQTTDGPAQYCSQASSIIDFLTQVFDIK